MRNVKLNKNKIFEIPDNFTERKNKETTHQTFLGVARNFVFLRSEWMKNFWKHLERKIFVEIFNNNSTTPDKKKRKRTLKRRKIFQFSFHLAYSKLAEAFWFMMIYEEAIKSWFLAPMFWGQFRCCREKYQRKSCALLLHFFLLLVFFCYWGNGFLLPSSRRSRWSVINFLCSSCRQSGFWGQQPTHIHTERAYFRFLIRIPLKEKEAFSE